MPKLLQETKGVHLEQIPDLFRRHKELEESPALRFGRHNEYLELPVIERKLRESSSEL